MALERIRKSSFEIELEGRISHLYSMVDTLAMSIRAALPTAQIPDFRSWYPGYVSQGIPQFHQPLNGGQILDGRGPRFCSKYNLARSDEERQALLDSLPKYGGLKIEWEKRFKEYRTHLAPNGWSNGYYQPLAVEFQSFYKTLCDEERFVEIKGTLENLVDLLPVSLNFDDSVLMPHGTFYRKIDGAELAFLEAPEIMGYVVVFFDHTNTNCGYELRYCIKAIVRWSVHELCWVVAPADAIDGPSFNAVFQRWHDQMGFPPYEEITNEQLIVVAEHARQRAANEWLWMSSEEGDRVSINHKRLEKRTVTLDGVLQLEIIPPAIYYNDWVFRCYFLDTEEDIASCSSFTLFTMERGEDITDAIRPFCYINDKGQFCTSIKHHARQRARIARLLNHFVGAPTESFVITDTLRDSSDSDVVDDDE